MNYYKILNKDERHYSLQYKTGLNVDPKPFNPNGNCEPGGIYFSREDILAFLGYGPWIRKVTLPKDALVYENPGVRLMISKYNLVIRNYNIMDQLNFHKILKLKRLCQFQSLDYLYMPIPGSRRSLVFLCAIGSRLDLETHNLRLCSRCCCFLGRL